MTHHDQCSAPAIGRGYQRTDFPRDGWRRVCLRGRLSVTPGDRDNQSVVEQSRFQRVSQRRECQQDDPMCLAQFMEFPLRVIRV